MKQLITISKTGALFGLDHKRKGLDLAKLGRAIKKRVSDIQWDDFSQMWFIRFLSVGRYSDQFVTTGIAREAGISEVLVTLKGVGLDADTGVLFFPDYEDAVTAEVAIIQGLQRLGKLAV